MRSGQLQEVGAATRQVNSGSLASSRGGPFVLPSVDETERHDHWEREDHVDRFKWPFLRSIAKIATIATGGNSDWRDYYRETLFLSSGETCHFNLFPLNFPRLGNWDEGATRFTGIPDKGRYQDWCVDFRFPVLRKFVEQYQPIAIVCAVGKSAPWCKQAFLGSGCTSETGTRIPFTTSLSGSSEPKSFEQYDLDNGTKLLLTPFFGQGGLLANADFEALGRHIAQL